MSEWVSVKERLPEKSGVYLIYCKDGLTRLIEYSAKHKLFCCYDSFKVGFALPTVTHWQQVPEPPKGCKE